MRESGDLAAWEYTDEAGVAAKRVEVMRGSHRDLRSLIGPLPGYRAGDVVAHELELPERFEPWPLPDASSGSL